MYLIVSGSTHFLCPPCRLFFSFFVFFFVLVRHVCCVQAPFHCTEAFNAESATRVMLLMFITLSIFVKSFDKHTQGMRCWFRVSLWWNVFTKTDRDPHCFLGFFCMCGCECECVPRSPLFVCPLWALYLRVSPSVGGTNRSANAERKDVRFASAALKARQNKSSTRLLGYTSTPALKQKTWSTAQKMWRKVYF